MEARREGASKPLPSAVLLLRQPEKQQAIPLGARDLLGDRAERLVALALELKAIVEDLHDVGLALEILDEQAGRYRQPALVGWRHARRGRVIQRLPVARPRRIVGDADSEVQFRAISKAYCLKSSGRPPFWAA